jgi:hypothetical protein
VRSPEISAGSTPVRAALIVIGVALLFIGGIFLAIAGRSLLDEWRYQERGVRVEATATGKTLHRATDASSTAYEIAYRFRLPRGDLQVQSEVVSVHVWEGVDLGSRLRIEYVRDDVSTARVVRAERAGVSRLLWLALGGVLVLGGLIAGAQGIRRTPKASEPPRTPEPEVAQERSFWPLARRTSGFWFGGMFLAAGLPALLGGASQVYEDLTFPRRASVASGMVLTKDFRRSSTGRSSTRHYEATYRYVVAGGTFEGRDQVQFDAWKQLNERGPSTVLYLPEHPAASRLAGPRPWGGAVAFALIGALFSSIGSTFFFGAIRRARLEWRLRQSGVTAPATIVELRERNVKIDGIRQWRLHYEYRDFRGGAHSKSVDLPEDEAQHWKVGDAGSVVYDAARPGAAMWVGRP